MILTDASQEFVLSRHEHERLPYAGRSTTGIHLARVDEVDNERNASEQPVQRHDACEAPRPECTKATASGLGPGVDEAHHEAGNHEEDIDPRESKRIPEKQIRPELCAFVLQVPDKDQDRGKRSQVLNRVDGRRQAVAVMIRRSRLDSWPVGVAKR